MAPICLRGRQTNMGVEIERKFLLRNDSWRGKNKSIHCCQGYLSTSKERTVRVRTMGQRGYLTIKGTATRGVRAEYEYEIPFQDAREMLDTLCRHPLVEKVRHLVSYEGFTWEIDEFLGDNVGLIVAEIELDHAGQEFPNPPWIGDEVSGEARYCNSNLSQYPFREWSEIDKEGHPPPRRPRKAPL